MNCLKSFVDDVLSSKFPQNTNIKERVEKSDKEIDVIVLHQNNTSMVKIMNISGIREETILKLCENNLLMIDCCKSSIYPSEMFQLNGYNEYISISREYYDRDIEELIKNESLSQGDITNVTCAICDIMMIFIGHNIVVGNLKSSNIIYEEDSEIKLCDLFLNLLREKGAENMGIYDINFKSPEELNGLECDERSVIWSIGCILYEMINKKLPFNEDENMNKTLNNILRCKYSFDVECDNDMMKKKIDRMLKLKIEDRISLIELKKEMTKMNEIVKDDKNIIDMLAVRKEILYNNNTLPVVFPSKYYVNNDCYEDIRDNMIKCYNNKPNERVLSILLMMKLYKEDYTIIDKLKLQIHHECEIRQCHLDGMVFNIGIDVHDKEMIKIDNSCVCLCEEGMDYFFRILKLINSVKLIFAVNYNITEMVIPFKCHALFGSLFSKLSNLQELDLSNLSLSFHFVKSFISSIPFMKLKHVNMSSNPIGSKGLMLLLPYLHLLLMRNKYLNLIEMNLDDKSIISLSEELDKYPNLEEIYVKRNKNIHSTAIKALFSKCQHIYCESCKELLIDKEIPELVRYIEDRDVTMNYVIDMINFGVDDNFFNSFISLRSNEFKEIQKLYLINNKLTYKSIEVLINNLSSFPRLEELHIKGNEIGDEGMKILSPHFMLLKDYDYVIETGMIDCSELGLSSIGLKYLVDAIKKRGGNYGLIDISGNNIDAEGIDYLVKNIDIDFLFLHNNPIGNSGFKLLLDRICMVMNGDYEIDLSNTSIDDESVMLLADGFSKIRSCVAINLKGNNIKMNGLKSICEKSLKKYRNPFIKMNNTSWTTEEKEYYLDYCVNCVGFHGEYDFSNLNLNDSHISLIKRTGYQSLNLSNNNVSCNGLKELKDHSVHYLNEHISICSNEIGDEGIEIICNNLNSFVKVDCYGKKISLNLSNVGMNEKGLKTLIERLKGYEQLKKIDIEGNELNERELRLMIDNEEIFYKLDELSITVKENIDKSELKTFLDCFSTVRLIKLGGISAKEKIELKKVFYNIE